MLCDEEDRDRCEADADSHQKPEETSKGFFPRASGESGPCKHLDFGPMIPILDFWPPEL